MVETNMTDAAFISILLSLVATLFALLVCVMGWIGSKLYQRVNEMASSMQNIERDLHGKIVDLDRRVTRVEAFIPLHTIDGRPT